MPQILHDLQTTLPETALAPSAKDWGQNLRDSANL